jgi:hypothetical protein
MIGVIDMHYEDINDLLHIECGDKSSNVWSTIYIGIMWDVICMPFLKEGGITLLGGL